MSRNNGKYGSSGCGGCLCLAFILVLFATASPYWMWQRYWFVNTAYTSTLATGTYVISSSSTSFQAGWYTYYYVSAQWNSFDSFNDTLCTDVDLYQKIGQFGFCTDEKTYQTPSEIKALQGLMTAASIILFFTSIFAIIAPSKGGSKLGFVAAALSFISMCLTCAAFSVAASFSWYKNLHDGTAYIPFIVNFENSGCTECVTTTSTPAALEWGPAFGSTVTAFIICFFATVVLCTVSKSLDDEDLDGGNPETQGQNADIEGTEEEGLQKA